MKQAQDHTRLALSNLTRRGFAIRSPCLESASHQCRRLNNNCTQSIKGIAMSTRCNVVITDGHSTLWFYRHSDGYPSVTATSLKTFLRWRIEGKIRDNVGQAAGWLVLLGAMEYQTLPGDAFSQHGKKWYDWDQEAINATLVAFSPENWQCGAYQPTTGEHGDIEYLYVIDLMAKEIRCCRPGEMNSPFYVITAENISLPLGK